MKDIPMEERNEMMKTALVTAGAEAARMALKMHGGRNLARNEMQRIIREYVNNDKTVFNVMRGRPTEAWTYFNKGVQNAITEAESRWA